MKNIVLLCHMLACVTSFGQSQEGTLQVTYPTFDQSLLLESTSETSANIAFGDLNGDGNLDVVLAKGRHWPLFNRIIIGDGNGGIMTSENLGTIENRSYTAFLSDLDLDGDLDIVVSNDSPDPKITYLNDGNGDFNFGSEFGDPNWNTRNVNVADLNNDGYPDIIVANRNNKGDSTNNYLCLNNGSGGFDNNCIAFSNYSSTTITSGDFNNDNLIDLVVPHRDGGQSYVYVQTDQNTINFDLIPFGPPNASIRTSQVGDLNNDGLMDIVTIDINSGVIAYFQQFDLSFSSGIPIGNQAASPKALSLADLNTDGNIDIIVGFVQTSSVVYYNNDNANNFIEVEFGENNQGTVYGFAIGDFNTDGQVDIGAAKSGASNIIYFGDNSSLGYESFSQNSFILYPNPTNGFLMVKAKEEIQSLKIYSIQKTLVKEVSSFPIDISELSAGIYFVQVSIKDKITTKRFIKY